MRLACYKDRNESRRRLRFAVSPDEYKNLKLGEGKFDVIVNEGDGNIVLKRDRFKGSTFGHHKGEYQFQRIVETQLAPFSSVEVPSSEIGNPDDEILAMIDTYKLALSAPRLTKPNGAHKVTNIPTPAPVLPPNAKIMRKVHELLGDFFDENVGRYREGYSDTRVAKEADCSVTFVQKQREEAYGELAPEVDVRLKQLAYQVQQIRKEMSSCLQDLELVETALENMFKEQQKPRSK